MSVDVQDRPAARLAAVTAWRRRPEEQVETPRSFEGRLSDEVRAARRNPNGPTGCVTSSPCLIGV